MEEGGGIQAPAVLVSDFGEPLHLYSLGIQGKEMG